MAYERISEHIIKVNAVQKNPILFRYNYHLLALFVYIFINCLLASHISLVMSSGYLLFVLFVVWWPWTLCPPAFRGGGAVR
jgi:hypothetical protein